jgi:hypothetical protein
MKANISGGKVMAQKKKLMRKNMMLNLPALHFSGNLFVYMLLLFMMHHVGNILSWTFWFFYEYTKLARYCQINTVKSDILKLFYSIQKYSTGKFAFTLFKSVTVNVHL